MQKHLRLIAVVLVLIGISFVLGCGGGEETITGEGTITFDTLGEGTATYTGQLVNGLMHGQGTATYADGSRYEGGWKDDKKHGQGTATYPDGSGYEIKDGEIHDLVTTTNDTAITEDGYLREVQIVLDDMKIYLETLALVMDPIYTRDSNWVETVTICTEQVKLGCEKIMRLEAPARFVESNRFLRKYAQEMSIVMDYYVVDDMAQGSYHIKEARSHLDNASRLLN